MTANDLISSLPNSAESLHPGWLWGVFGGLLGAWLALWLKGALGVRRRHHVAVRRAARAQRGEDRGEDLLLAAGYTVLERQATLRTAWFVDGVREDYTLRADWVVERAGVRWVADAKTGDWARNVQTRATRRQMLEYVVQYDVEGALLVDAEHGRIVELRFERPADEEQPPAAELPWLWGAMFCAALLLLIWRFLS